MGYEPPRRHHCRASLVRLLELFAGAGGASMGIEAAGAESVLGVEWDASAVATAQAAGHPTIQGDVRDLSLYDGLEVDALWSSFPCQDWSSAGKRKGASGDRNGWPWTVDVIDKVRPRWFLAENVTGLLQHRGCEKRCKGIHDPEACPRAYFDRVILEQLRERFAWVGFKVLCAADYGTPQFRKRVIICAGPRAIKWPAPTHGKPSEQADLFGRKLKPWVTVRDALGLGRIADNGFRVLGGGSNPRAPGEGHKRTLRDITDEPSTTIAAQSGGGAGNAGPFVQYRRGRDGGAVYESHSVDEPSCALRGSAGRSTQPFIKEEQQRRRLSITECLILMGWPADYPMQGTKTSQYRQAGNGCCPQMVSPVIRAVMAAD